MRRFSHPLRPRPRRQHSPMQMTCPRRTIATEAAAGQRVHSLFFTPESESKDFSSVLQDVQEYISGKYSTLITDGVERIPRSKSSDTSANMSRTGELLSGICPGNSWWTLSTPRWPSLASSPSTSSAPVLRRSISIPGVILKFCIPAARWSSWRSTSTAPTMPSM